MTSRFFVSISATASAFKQVLLLVVLVSLSAFTGKDNDKPADGPAKGMLVSNTYTDQTLAITASPSVAVYADNTTIYTYTFNTTRTPVAWTISGGTIVTTSLNTKTVTVKWTNPNGTITATSAYVTTSCTTIDPAPYQCCWTPPTGQTCSSPNNPCNGQSIAAASTESTSAESLSTESTSTSSTQGGNGSSKKDGGAVALTVPGQCCSTIDPPAYQECNYVRHKGTLTVSPIDCSIGNPTLSAGNQTSIYYGQTTTLTATPGIRGTTVRWFDAPTGGTLLYTGNTYTTPAINVSAVTYYAESYNPTPPSTVCPGSSARVAVTVNAACPTMAIPVATASASEAIYGKSVTITATPGAGNIGVRWYMQAIGGTSFFTGTSYTTPGESAALTYYLESYGMSGTVECKSARVPVVITRPSRVAVQTEQVRVAGVYDPSQVAALADNNKFESVTYLDGLGRSVQSTSLHATPSGKDVVSFAEYDAFGRAPKQYMPYVADANNGLYRNNFLTKQAEFYNTTTDKIADDAMPYTQTVYETSPYGRVLEQGMPGTDRQPGSGHTQRYEYKFNDTDEVRKFNADGTSTTFIAANTMARMTATDPDNKKTIVYTDGRGQTVLKKQQLDETIDGNNVPYLETYYLYNDLGHVVYVITPKGVALLKTNGWNFTAIKNDYTYQFIYDELGRVIEKKVPGQGWSYIVYDNLGRMVLTQDAKLAEESKWLYVKYDRKHRPVSTGLYKNTSSRSAIQSMVNNVYKTWNTEYPQNAWYEGRASDATNQGYTNVSFPKKNADNTALEILGVSYYDNYDFDWNGTADYSYVVQSLQGEGIPTTFTANMPTGSKRLVLGTTTWLTTYVFYDTKGRAIQVRTNNHLNTDIASAPSLSTMVYDDFEGRVKLTKNIHHAGSAGVTTVINKMDYDVHGRLAKIWQSNNGSADQLVVQYEYNDLGQVVDKKLHGTGAQFLQSVDYRYDILGQLRSINNASLGADASNDDTDSNQNDYFGMELLYNQTDAGVGNTAMYNGSISAIKWKGIGEAAGSKGQQSFAFSYDKSGKLETAASKAHDGTGWNSKVGWLNETMSYDHNGNILSLARNEGTSTGTAQQMDNLSYTYSADKLTKVEDASSVARGFANGANTAQEYTYDNNGSITKDDNKGVSSIVYNFLGKPALVNFTDGRKIEYTYDAGGTKLTMKTYQGTTLQSTTDYAGGFVYENGALSFFGAPEGRVVKNGSTLEHQYAIADNQGNTRVVFTSAIPAPESDVVNFEASTNTNVQNYTNRVNWELMDHTDAANDGTDYAQKLIALGNSRVGVAKAIKVYPGDKVKIEAYAKYYNTTSTTASLTGFGSALLNAFSLSAPGVGETGTPSAALSGWGSFVEGGQNGNSSYPKAFVSLIVFDKNYGFLDAAWNQIDGGEQIGTGTKAAHDYMTQEYTVKEEGYIFAYVSNENTTAVEVYFDDVVITKTKSNVIQYSEYYPFGLQTASSWTRENTTGNNFLYNAANELNQNTGWYEMYFRGYDPATGRMLQVDPYATMFASASVYNYALGNPVMMNDPSGGKPHIPSAGELYNMEQLKERADEAMRTGGMGAGGGGGGHGSYRTGMGSGNYWSDGIGMQDWSGHSGSDNYRLGVAAGLIDIGGSLYLLGPDGQRVQAQEVDGKLSIPVRNSRWTEYDGVEREGSRESSIDWVPVEDAVKEGLLNPAGWKLVSSNIQTMHRDTGYDWFIQTLEYRDISGTGGYDGHGLQKKIKNAVLIYYKNGKVTEIIAKQNTVQENPFSEKDWVKTSPLDASRLREDLSKIIEKSIQQHFEANVRGWDYYWYDMMQQNPNAKAWYEPLPPAHLSPNVSTGIRK